MKQKPIIPRSAASRDVDDALDYYLAAASEQVAKGFIDELERAYTHIARHPGSGSARYGHALNIAGLQSWSLDRYPYVVFYLERLDHVDIWRILHSKRDIPAWMQASDKDQ